MRLLRLVALLVGLAWALAQEHARPRELVCPRGCEVWTEPVGGERLRAMCWCDRGRSP